ALREALRELPWAAEVLTVDGFVGRLSDDALWFVETILDGARLSGCTAEESVGWFRNRWYFTVGEILVRAPSGASGGRNVDRARLLNEAVARFEGRDVAKVPQLAAIGAGWPALASQDSFESGVRSLVHGALEHRA